MTTAQKIAEIEAEMTRTQKNKATSYHLGLLKAKLAKLKREMIDSSSKKGGGTQEGFEVSKSGDSRIGMIGFPSVGKSTLLTKLTGVFSKIAAYEFTTLTCIPGVLQHKGAKIQLLDLPGIIEGAKDGKGRGKQVIAVARTCNLILIVLDATRPMVHKKIIERELEGFGIRLNKQPPQIEFKKRDKGGITISRTQDAPRLDDETIKAILREYKINNCDINLKCDATDEDLIDVIEGNRKYIPCLYNSTFWTRFHITCPSLPFWNGIWNELVERIWDYLDLIRIYTKPKGLEPDYNAPVIVQRKFSTITDFCNKLHKSMIKDFRYALVWGASVKYNPQKVGKDHQLLDEDIVQIVKKI
ncbi:unnamed protein product (macronuclear) [Paramecium tetraurelia]|uniref:Developmentally-regulated GTP-binding protein 1 n=1 Tax=Paramecium tetraurelia TaxID=5888 RepID=A0CAD4_PARTE|nr:uncharacterized protein GSPATT00036531001 [Paramecium tetraurelia]CAK67751.1 unnamed protein product [Paramecium tetraurelia]|eukprot:XP_001435148.1 hypothetical protein (macronuclear) [Paramecium tetraurelia strain d4-2]